MDAADIRMPLRRFAGTIRRNKHRDDRAHGRLQNPLAQNDIRAGEPSRRWEARWNLWKGQCPDAYVGKESNLRGRLRQHDTNKRRDYWDRGLVFRLTAEAVSKPKLAWLEEQVHALVAPNGQRSLRVRNRAHLPTETELSADELSDAERWLRDVRAVLDVLGFVVGATPASGWFSVTRAEGLFQTGMPAC